MNKLDEFVSDSIFPTPAMTVIVQDSQGTVLNIYKTPKGFQLARYLSHRYKDYVISKPAQPMEFNMFVCNVKQLNGTLVERHTGIYESMAMWKGQYKSSPPL